MLTVLGYQSTQSCAKLSLQILDRHLKLLKFSYLTLGTDERKTEILRKKRKKEILRQRNNATVVIFYEGYLEDTYSLLAYGFPQLAVESTEPIDTIAVVFFKTSLHKLHELWLLSVICCEREKKVTLYLGKRKF